MGVCRISYSSDFHCQAETPPRNSIIAPNVSGMQPVHEENVISCRQINVNLKPANKARNKDSLDTDAALAECIFDRNERHATPNM